MKIGIVTIVDNYNFGNRLQNYAVYYFFKKEYGIRAITLTSHADGRIEHGAVVPALKDEAVLLLSAFPRILKRVFSPRVCRWVSFVNWSRHIPTKHYYNNLNLPLSVGRHFDYFFAGSDQIWNYTFASDRLYNYFLQFAESDKRASISASFGVEEIPDEWKQRYKEGLSEMKHISVREDAGAKIVKELTGRDVPVLVDPVMMLDREEWLSTANKPRVNCSVPYVLKYYLGDDNKEIDLWAEQNGYKVYELMNLNDPDLYSAGPGEFLSLIDHAALVCSDSFHCIAFSILFRKPFIVYKRKGKLNNMTSRMDTLLSKFGFESRWNYLLNKDEYLKCDYRGFDDRLEKERQRFRDYVKKVIGMDAQHPHLADKNNCTGCTACKSVCPKHCIEMRPDENGFLYPFIDEDRCIRCGACEKTCPILNTLSECAAPAKAYAAYSLDEPVRFVSSSGGVFSEIAKSVLNQGGAVFGAAYDENYDVSHRVAESLTELEALRGAKYVQSRLGKSFLEIKTRLDRGQMVLFSGTPCQVGGLKAFLKRDYENLICVDFVCHSIPSPMAWKKYVEYRAKTDHNGVLPIDINLRDKRSGWSRYHYSNTFRYPDGVEHSVLSANSLYMKLFINDYISRLSCGHCKFKGSHRASDITLGDFWGIWEIAPEMDDNKGTSVVLIHTSKGEQCWDRIKNQIHYKQVELSQAGSHNASMLFSSSPNRKRNTVLNMIRLHGFSTFPDGLKAGKALKIQRQWNKIINH